MRDRSPKMLDFLGLASWAQVLHTAGPEASGYTWNSLM